MKKAKLSYEEAEDLVLAATIDFSSDRIYGFSLEEAADMLTKTPRNATFSEYLKIDEDVPGKPFQSNLSYVEAEILSRVLRTYQNFAEKVNRPDNWLAPKEHSAAEGWKYDYQVAVANFLLEHGQQYDLNISYYGWTTPRKPPGRKPVAVFHLTEQRVSEFGGTFVDSDMSTIVVAEVMYGDGQTKYVRWTGSLGEIVRAITK